MSKLDLNRIPKHVCIIMDGNRRWARQHGMEVFLGHKKMVDEGIDQVVDHALKRGIKFLTLWAFSTENWKRERKEVDYLMKLFRKLFDKKIDRYHQENIKINTIGRIADFAPDIQEKIKFWKEKTKNNTGLTLTFALSYGGRDEIVRSTKDLFNKTVEEIDFSQKNSKVILKQKISEIQYWDLEDCFDTNGLPDPEMIIRTGGERRLSGFMPYQSTYAEFFFPKVFMPDFKGEEFDKVLFEFQSRDRRFGK